MPGRWAWLQASSKVPRCGWPRRCPEWLMTGRIFTSCRSSRAVPLRTSIPSFICAELIWRSSIPTRWMSTRSRSRISDRHVKYLLSLFPSELHVFVRPEIQSLQDLAGKKVNFNTLGTAAAYSGPLIFSRLGINIEKTFIPHPLALQQMRKGDMAAVVFVTAKPVDAFVRGQWEPGFKFLPVSYDLKFEDYYLPAFLEASDYPALVKPGERVATLAVPTVLATYNWPVNSDRYRRVARFTDYLFGRIDKLQVPGFDPNWKTINLGATVPGLSRFSAAQEWLDRQSRQGARKQ